MRKCIRCNEEMIDDYSINIWGFGTEYIDIVSMKNRKKIKLKRPLLSICPNCGEISIYIKDTTKLQNNK